jgi:hypothetical protein
MGREKRRVREEDGKEDRKGSRNNSRMTQEMLTNGLPCP